MYANRGMELERMVELSNSIYRRNMEAEIQKVPTGVRILSNKHGKVQGFLEGKGTVDFTGIANFDGEPIPIAFDAKETKGKSLPVGNIAEHQVEYMTRFELLGGQSFILVHFTELDRYFRLKAKRLAGYMESPWPKNQKSIPIKYFEDYGYEIKREANSVLNYLEGLDGQ